MDLTEKQQCVLCDKVGNLLVCNSEGCPISVHKNCMGCEARLDDSGNFNCPYCIYKRLTVETSQLRSKVMLTKKALSTFLEKETIDNNHHETVNKDEEISSKKNENYDDDRNVSVNLEENIDVNTCRIMIVYEPKSNDCYSYKDDGIEGEKVKKSKSPDIWSTMDTQNTRKKRKRSDKKRRKEERRMKKAAKVLESLQKSNSEIDSDVAKDTKNDDISKPEGVKDSSKQKLKLNIKIDSNVAKKGSLDTKNDDISKPEGVKDSSKPKLKLKLKNKIDSDVAKKGSLDTKIDDVSKPDGVKDSSKHKLKLNIKIDSNVAKKGSLDTKNDDISKPDGVKDSSKQKLKLNIKIDSNVAKKGSLDMKNDDISKPEGVKDSSKQKLKPNNKIDHKVSDSLLDQTNGQKKQKLKPNNKIDHEVSDSLLDQTNGDKKESLETKKINISNSGKLKDSTNQLPVTDRNVKLPFEVGKHRVPWSKQEEQMLKEGVEKFAETARKNLPWNKILEFGRDVFSSSRNPSDLKDKWRKIAK